MSDLDPFFSLRAPLRVTISIPARFPVALYGGAERAAYYLGKGLSELGVRVTFHCDPESKIPFAERVCDVAEPLPDGQDILQVYSTPGTEPKAPFLVCIQGNGKPGERFLRNTVFISQNHAERHNSREFVYNGIDFSEYPLGTKSEKSRNQLLFLAKASWPVKNLRGAIDLASATGCRLAVAGGSGTAWERWRFRHVDFFGMVGGEQKMGIIKSSEAMLFPVLWDEPFGIAVIEAMACGVPVFASPFGSLPEIVTNEVGRICSNRAEFLAAIESRAQFRGEEVRAHAESRFSHSEMARGFMRKYAKILTEGTLTREAPGCENDFVAEKIYRIPGVVEGVRARWKRWRQRSRSCRCE